MTTLEGTWTYTYDAAASSPAGRPPTAAPPTYTYDAMGNRIQVDQNGVTTELHDEQPEPVHDRGRRTTYTYDADGNLIRTQSGNDVTTYSYDPQNRLIAVTHGADSQTYTYDALGNRFPALDDGIDDPVPDRPDRPGERGRAV